MEEERKAESKDIVVLDKGVILTVDDGPRWLCCWGALIPLRA